MDKEKFEVIPQISVNGVFFGTNREETRKAFGAHFKEFKKTSFSKNTTDAYDSFHVFYTSDNKFEAIEFFGNVKVLIGKRLVFPGKVSRIQKLFEDFEDDGEGFTSIKYSIGITIDEDNPLKIDGILFGSEGYYESLVEHKV